MDIYCGNCGQRNETSARFCEKCGQTIVHDRPSMIVSPPRKRSWLAKLASVGASIAIICFFLPWVSVSCSTNPGIFTMPATTVSGYQIASGNFPLVDNLNNLGGLFGGISGLDSTGVSDSISTYLNGETSSPAVWLILLIGIIGLSTLIGGKKGGKIAIGIGILGIIALFVFGIKLGSINSQISISGFKVKTEAGLILEWLGFLFMTGMGITSILYDSE